MCRLPLLLLLTVLVSGCAGLEPEKVWERSSALLAGSKEGPDSNRQERSSANPTPKELKREVEQLFAQPYIDPLTRYLRDHAGDTGRVLQLRRVGQERERRCEAIAGRYREGPLNAPTLARYQAGYQFSCPDDVEAYARRLRQQQASQAAVAPESTEPHPADETLSRQLNDCYLLTTIRNFTAALKACREPAESGDLKAQTNMALISYALQDYANAGYWAREAAPDSGTASYLLGEMYAAGLGVAQSHKEAEAWYSQAVKLGHPGAKAALQGDAASRSGESLN